MVRQKEGDHKIETLSSCLLPGEVVGKALVGENVELGSMVVWAEESQPLFQEA